METDSTSPSVGRHFLQIPGPTNLPDEVARAISRPTIDHRGPEFRQLTRSLLQRLARVFGCSGPIIIYPSSGRGAWEAALVNTLSPGDTVLICETGHFASLWRQVVERLGLTVERLQQDWHQGVDATALAAYLRADEEGRIKAIALVHNETSTGVVNDVKAVRQAMVESGHKALLMVDVVSSLGSMPYIHDDWGVDVTVAASQKGLMLPPGLGFCALSDKALAATSRAGMPRSFWDWRAVIEANESGSFPYTPATNLLFGLDVALDMLLEEGLAAVYARQARYGAATRAAVKGWGLACFCQNEMAYSAALTAVELPEGFDSDALRALILRDFNMSLGTGLGPLKGRVFRIGHLGQFNDLMLMGTLSGVEMGLARSGIPYRPGGVQHALEYLASHE